ncbi:hypothetical protein [Actinopolyspora erythraea]|uniref:hypothetical protein n=1 Tax=Actinopolyspora erythraea TaxID=414996 RepID=UPI0012FDC4B0|nr:hypothetical protein [Actinopolyspora erythraea]
MNPFQNFVMKILRPLSSTLAASLIGRVPCRWIRFATHLLVVGAGSVVLDPLAPPVGVFMLGIAVGVAGIVVPNQFFVRLRRRTGIPLPGELRELVDKVAPLMAERLSLYRNLARVEYSGWTAPMKRARSRWIAWRFNRAIRRFGWLMTDRAERAHRAARRGHWGRWHTHVTTMLEGLSHAVREEAPAAENSRHY